MLVVIDTNVLVSSLINPKGLPARVMDMVFSGEIKICYSNEIVTEYKDVLLRPKFNFDYDTVEEWLGCVLSRGYEANPLPSTLEFIDESDRIFYDVARVFGATLITGNLRHYPQESFIVTLTEFFNEEQ